MRARKPFEERLAMRIAKAGPDDCWLWTGGTAGKGYGSIKKEINGKWQQVYAHRESLRLSKGEPTDLNNQALHSCDNPTCCNPSHLNWGTESQNRREARDRLHNQGNQKLKPIQVDAIRADPRVHTVIAEIYGVHHDTVARIKQGRGWKP